MKKKLNVENIENELSGSVFFPQSGDTLTPLPSEHTVAMEQLQDKPHDTTIPRYHDTMTPRNHDTTVSATDEATIEEIRKAVRQIGKEPATQRLTLEEKQALADIEYSYKRQGIKTSSNEMIRIATNFIVREYQQNGENSILAKVLRKLNS